MEKKDIDNFDEILIEKSEKYDEKTSERFTKNVLDSSSCGKNLLC